MADISKITIESGTYDIKDETARNQLNTLNSLLINRKYLLIGDSYGEGYSPDGNVDGWPVLFKNIMGLTNENCKIYVAGGYGFVRPGHEFYFLINNIPNDTSITDVIILGGYNDRGGTYEGIKSAIQNCITLINTKFGNPKIHIGQVGTSTASSNTYPLYLITNYYKYSCRELGINYIDNIQFTLRIYYSMMSSDGFHPNSSGQYSIAWYLSEYIKKGHIDVLLGYSDYNGTAETDYILPLNFASKVTMNLYNDKLNIALKERISITVNNLTLKADSTWYKIATTTNGYIVGSSFKLNSVCVPFIIKSNNLYYVCNGTINFDDGLNICLFNVNDSNSNYGQYTNVTEIIIPPFSNTFDSLMC